MPSIGRPTGENSFQDIKMASKQRDARVNPNSLRRNDTVGDELNSMAGIRPDQKFVDGKEHNKLDKDGFLKLLTHQLTNQDPLSPMDQKKFAADMAQFAQLEQLANINTKMGKLGGNEPNENKFYGASFIGKEAITAGTSIPYDGESRQVNLPFFMDQAAKKVIVRIYDQGNQLVRQMEIDGMGAGQQSLPWDGLQNDGIPATKGDYHFEVLGFDQGFNQFKGKTHTTGVVTGVNFDDNGDTVLELDNSKKVFLRDVKAFKQSERLSAAKMPPLPSQAANAYTDNVKQ